MAKLTAPRNGRIRFVGMTERLHFILVELFGCFLEQQGGELHWIRRSPSANGNTKARLDVCQQLHRPKVAATGRDFALAFGAELTNVGYRGQPTSRARTASPIGNAAGAIGHGYRRRSDP